MEQRIYECVALGSEPSLEGLEFAADGHDPAFLIRVPLSAQGFSAILVREGDVQGRLAGGDPRRRGGGLGGARALKCSAIVGAHEPIEEALPLEAEP